MLKMKISLHNVLDGRGIPLETVVEGDAIELLKYRINASIVEAVKASGKKSGHYLVEIRFIEREKPLGGITWGACFCDLQKGRFIFTELKEKNQND